MELKLNLNPKILIRLTEAIEQLAKGYRTVHAAVLEPIEGDVVDSYIFLQDDRKVYEQEQREKKGERLQQDLV